MNILRNVGALLDLSLLNDASYRVDLVDQGNGNMVSVVPSTLVAPNGGWTAIPSAAVNPDLVKIGHNYKIQITTTYHAVVTVVASGEVGYDNVRLTTAAASAAGGGGGNGGSGITDIKHLRKLVKHYILPSSMKVNGRFLVVHLRCPAVASPEGLPDPAPGSAEGQVLQARHGPQDREAQGRQEADRQDPHQAGIRRVLRQGQEGLGEVHRPRRQGPRQRPQADQAQDAGPSVPHANSVCRALAPPGTPDQLDLVGGLLCSADAGG